MNRKLKLNKTDHVIIQELRRNGRRSLNDIASLVNKTAAYIGQRFNVLRANNVIKGVYADIDEAYYGIKYYCFAFIKTEHGIDDKFMIKQFSKIDEVVDAYGDDCANRYMVKFGCLDFEHMKYVKKRILELQCVRDIDIFMSSQKKMSKVPLLEYDYERQDWVYLNHESEEPELYDVKKYDGWEK